METDKLVKYPYKKWINPNNELIAQKAYEWKDKIIVLYKNVVVDDLTFEEFKKKWGDDFEI